MAFDSDSAPRLELIEGESATEVVTPRRGSSTADEVSDASDRRRERRRLSSLQQRISGLARREVMSRGGTREDAEDIAQDTLWLFERKRPDRREDYVEGRWLRCTIRNLTLKHLDKNRRRPRAEDVDDQSLESPCWTPEDWALLEAFDRGKDIVALLLQRRTSREIARLRDYGRDTALQHRRELRELLLSMRGNRSCVFVLALCKGKGTLLVIGCLLSLLVVALLWMGAVLGESETAGHTPERVTVAATDDGEDEPRPRGGWRRPIEHPLDSPELQTIPFEPDWTEAPPRVSSARASSVHEPLTPSEEPSVVRPGDPGRSVRRSARTTTATEYPGQTDGELSWLLRARKESARGNHRKALALLDRHLQHHPAGGTEVLREKIRIDVLCRSGRHRDVRAARTSFVRRFGEPDGGLGCGRSRK